MESWSIDPQFSSVTFSIPNLGETVVRGRFSEWAGHLELDDTGAISGSIEMCIMAASLSTGVSALDEEALSPRFLDAGTHPYIGFSGTDVIESTDEFTRLRGDLSIRGITAPIEVTARPEGRARDLTGRERMSYEVSTGVPRSAFGLLWHPALENVAGFLIGDVVQVTADIEFVRDE